MATEPPRLNWTSIDPTERLCTWQMVWRIAPDWLNRPILPVWMFKINSRISSAPQTEADAARGTARTASRPAVRRGGAGRGRRRQTAESAAFAEFLGMKGEIDAVSFAPPLARGADRQGLKMLREPDLTSSSACGRRWERARRMNRQGAATPV